ncbi:hypothetical protein [Lentzea cavernae]|uniref:N-acetylmuramoyl-L-alanine amidase n=1 Tax=Lentzea cavernae TaxID=2020703 RepID=A0ABQ3MRN1_9PSEU|nr:hypothetical protein [Lentzea cavernae]GHH57695.1 hypothetical protein GCM10017774_77670 [Lentzea cavernae]
MGAVEEILFFVSVFREFGVPVEFEPGWETRGNGSSAAYEGGILHHTGIPATYQNPGPGTRVLRDGRPDLSGPLCQFQNKFNGVVRVIAAHPANHAGAGAGRSMGPLPRTRLFNPRVVGMETDYAGNSPMSPEQYYVSKVFAIAVRRRYGSIERCRLHFETSEEGKWDAGWKPGTPIDANQFRRDALALEASGAHQEDDVSAEDVLNAPVPVGYDGKSSDLPLRQHLRGTNYGVWETHAVAVRLEQGQAGLIAAIAALSKNGALTAEQVKGIVDNAVRETTAAGNAAHLAALQAQLDAATATFRAILAERDETLAAEVMDELGQRLHAA